MSIITIVQVDENLSFLVEADNDTTKSSEFKDRVVPGLPPGASPTGILASATKTMTQTVAAVVKFVREGFEVGSHPDELKIEFGITLKGQAAIPIVINGSTEGTFRISATWKRCSDRDYQ